MQVVRLRPRARELRNLAHSVPRNSSYKPNKIPKQRGSSHGFWAERKFSERTKHTKLSLRHRSTPHRQQQQQKLQHRTLTYYHHHPLGLFNMVVRLTSTPYPVQIVSVPMLPMSLSTTATSATTTMTTAILSELRASYAEN